MQIRTKSLVGKYLHVLSTDPALDLKPIPEGLQGEELAAAEKARTEAIEAYRLAMETGKLEKLPVRDGEQPTVWELTHLTSDAGAWLLDQGSTEGNLRLSLHAFAMAVAGVKGGVKDEDGKAVAFKRAPRSSRAGFLALPDELVNALTTTDDGRLNVALIQEIGGRVAKELVPRNG